MSIGTLVKSTGPNRVFVIIKGLLGEWATADFWFGVSKKVVNDMIALFFKSIGGRFVWLGDKSYDVELLGNKAQQPHNGPSSAFNSSTSYGQPEYRSRPAGFPTQRDDSLFNNHSFGPR